MKKSNWMLKPHEVCIVLGCTIEKVFRLLAEGRIPAKRIRRKGRTEFLVSPAALKAWISAKRFSMNLIGETLLEEKAARERDHFARARHKKMVETTRRVESRLAHLDQVRAQQQRQFAELRRVAQLLNEGQQTAP